VVSIGNWWFQSNQNNLSKSKIGSSFSVGNKKIKKKPVIEKPCLKKPALKKHKRRPVQTL
jgi:hypothetical protein